VYYFDSLILDEIRKQNQLVLRDLYKTYFPMVANLVCSNSGSEDEAKDIYQETIIAFYERVQQPDFVLTCKIKTYIYAVSRRLWLKKLSEKRRFTVSMEDAENFAGVEEELTEINYNENAFIKMRNAMLQLGEPCKGILEDFYLHQRTMEEITLKFGYTNSDTAKNQKYKCLQRLKKSFFND
jgi:RNA polymerase sigma factor (sigma-70 family)